MNSDKKRIKELEELLEGTERELHAVTMLKCRTQTLLNAATARLSQYNRMTLRAREDLVISQYFVDMGCSGDYSRSEAEKTLWRRDHREESRRRHENVMATLESRKEHSLGIAELSSANHPCPWKGYLDTNPSMELKNEHDI